MGTFANREKNKKILLYCMDTKYVMDVFFQILNKLNHEIGCWNELWLKVHNYLCVAFLLVIFFVVVLKRNLF